MIYQQWQSVLRMAEDAISRARDGCADKDEFGQSHYTLAQLAKAIQYLEEAKEGWLEQMMKIKPYPPDETPLIRPNQPEEL